MSKNRGNQQKNEPHRAYYEAKNRPLKPLKSPKMTNFFFVRAPLPLCLLCGVQAERHRRAPKVARRAGGTTVTSRKPARKILYFASTKREKEKAPKQGGAKKG